MSSALNPADFLHAAPILFLAVWSCVVLLAAAFADESTRLDGLALLGLLLGAGVCAWSWAAHEAAAPSVFGGMLVVDRYALFLDMVFIVAAAVTVLVTAPYLRQHAFAGSELYALVLLAVTGMAMLVHAGDFLTFVIGLETMSFSVYGLVACWPGDKKSAEAGLKYFVMGAVASAFLLYGVALLYGATGETNLAAIGARAAEQAGSPLFVAGMYLVLGALAFKVALVPFHMWTPDAYEGAPSPVTGFMASAVKAAGFGALLRVLQVAFGADGVAFGSLGWVNVFWWVAAVTITVANVAALRQSNIKRMLAYSSISHAGTILIGVLASAMVPGQLKAVLFYLLAYAFTTAGAFGVVTWLGRKGRDGARVEQWAGLARRHPLAAFTMTLFLLSLAGMPPTAGFFAKLGVFRAALEQGGQEMVILVVVAALNSVVAIYYYLRPVVAMYFQPVPESGPLAEPLPRAGMLAAGLTLAAAAALLLGLAPGPVLAWAGAALMP